MHAIYIVIMGAIFAGCNGSASNGCTAFHLQSKGKLSGRKQSVVVELPTRR